MEDALDYSLNVLNIIQTNIVGKTRVDTPYFDAEAFREAWFNAVCHNLWVEKSRLRFTDLTIGWKLSLMDC